MKRFAVIVVFAASSSLASEAGERVLGAVLPNYAHKVAELRYRVAEDWEGINKFYRNTYPEKEYPRRNIVNQPGVKAFHIENPGKHGWEGLNIYQANDEIRVFVVPAESTKTKGKKSGKK
jgi:hypothetical protein